MSLFLAAARAFGIGRTDCSHCSKKILHCRKQTQKLKSSQKCGGHSEISAHCSERPLAATINHVFKLCFLQRHISAASPKIPQTLTRNPLTHSQNSPYQPHFPHLFTLKPQVWQCIGVSPSLLGLRTWIPPFLTSSKCSSQFPASLSI